MNALTCLSGLAQAGTRPHPIPPQFFVSALLQAPDDGRAASCPKVLLVHGVARGTSSDEVIGAFIRNAVLKYRGHAVLDTLVSSLTVTGCGQPGEMIAAARDIGPS